MAQKLAGYREKHAGSQRNSNRRKSLILQGFAGITGHAGTRLKMRFFELLRLNYRFNSGRGCQSPAFAGLFSKPNACFRCGLFVDISIFVNLLQTQNDKILPHDKDPWLCYRCTKRQRETGGCRHNAFYGRCIHRRTNAPPS